MLYESENENITLGLVGDVMLSRNLMPFREPDFIALRDLLRNTDATFANLETVIRNRNEGYPNFTQGTPMSTDPALLDDLKWLGIDLVSCANNHATDWGTTGLRAMLTHLRAAAIPCAGIGANLAEARAPCYLDTSAGRIGLVAMTGFFRPWNRASHQRADAIGRPGINPLGSATEYRVNAKAFSALEELSAGLGLDAARRRAKAQFYSESEVPDDGKREITLFGQRFRKGTGFAVATTPAEADVEGNFAAIHEARRQADWVVVSIHFHDFGGATAMSAERDIDMDEPTEFIRTVARDAIDNGADVIAGHGPHLTMGIELYRGKPILYSLGNAVFQNDTIAVVPDESYGRFGLGASATPADFMDARTDNERKGFPSESEYWQGMAGICRFEKGRLRGLEIHPLDLGFGRSRAQRGRPMLARGDTAGRILERICRLSEIWGTSVIIDGATARVDLSESR
jgi:poly-gamma-glutamate capsule biosynthesis protein CapA/YwtB (metallophosphatase superfamily)